MKIIEVLYLDVKGNKRPKIIKIDVETNEELYKLICCDTIDIVERKFGGKRFLVVCDDEALLKNERPILSVYSQNTYENVYGNIIIANRNGEDLDSITNVDYWRIVSRLATLRTDTRRYCLCVDKGEK